MEHDFTMDELSDLETDTKLAEYCVVPRPQELIASQLRASSSGAKVKSLKRKSVLKESVKKIGKKSKEKMSPKEKLMKSKDVKKSHPISKFPMSSTLSFKTTKAIGAEDLQKKFDSYVQSSKKNIKKKHLKSESSVKSTVGDLEKHSNWFELPVNEELSSQSQLLIKKLKEPSFTALERYEVLNSRDAFIRLRDAKKTESKRKKIEGTCPDMCPEKERYSRIAKNCLSVFEMNAASDVLSSSKDLDHSMMVKEYSRSSADQQEPLPNELRPVTVLKFTMDYLICNVINQYDENLLVADWYDFIWNRTRSIRKDITQQQLGDMQCVDILEKCARFHILCAELLSEEDIATFDPKINTENLNKCLQTLKHMYYDLQTRGIQCPNEAEFRAYDILLSLTEGETLRLVKNIRKEVLNSSHVKAAFEAALAFESNNYIKFFKLMEKASFLSSCIMHRFIYQARVRALQVIIRAYTVQNKPTMYPLSNLVKDLKFEDTVDAANFCTWHGLLVEDTEVSLQKQVFHKPSTNYPVARSSFLVGKKLQTNLGVIINNGPLPENPLQWYQPVNSFNEEGILLDHSIIIEEEKILDQEKLKSEVKAELKTQSPHVSRTSSPSTHKLKHKTFLTKSSKNELKNVENNACLLPEVAGQSVMKTPNEANKSVSILNKNSLPEKPHIKSEKLVSINNQNITSNSFTSTPQSVFFKGSTLLEKPKIDFKSSSDVTAQNKVTKVGQSPLQTLSSIPSTSTAPAFSFALKSFKWPDPSLDMVVKDPFEIQSITTLQIPVQSNKKDQEIPSLEITENNNDTSIIDIHHKCFKDDNDSCISQSEASTINRKSPNVISVDESYSKDVSLADGRGIAISEYGDNSLQLLDEEDEETLTKMRDQKISELILDINDEIYSQCIEELSERICKETVTEEWNKKIEQDDNKEKMRIHLAKKVIFKWKLFCERKKQRYIYKNSEPVSPWIPMLMNTEYVTSGAASPFFVYKKHCSISRLAETKIKERMIKPGWEPMTAEDFASVKNHVNFPISYFRTTAIQQFLKIGVVFASLFDENIDLFKDWICKKLKLSAVSDDKMQQTKQMSFYSLNGGKTVICISAVTLELHASPAWDDFMNGMSAMIFCCPTRFPDLKIFNSIQDRLLTLLNKNVLSSFPMFAILIPSKKKLNVVNQLASFLDDILYSGRSLSSVKVTEFSEPSNSIKDTKELTSAIKWLIENQEPVPELLNCSLQNYIEDSFTSVFNAVFWKLSLQEFKPLSQLPQHIIRFYNEVIKARAELLCTPLLLKVIQCWPPQELLMLQLDYRFINTSFQKKCMYFMKNLFLPDFDGDPSCLQDMWLYIRKIAIVPDSSCEMLFINIESVLQNSSEYIEWANIISKCAYYLLCHHTSKVNEHLEDDVFYLKEDLDAMNFESYWQNFLLTIKEQQMDSKKRKTSELQNESEKRLKDKHLISDSLYHHNENDTLDLPCVADISSVSEAANSHVEDLLHSLRTALKEQTEEEDKFMNKLNESVATENIFDESSFDERHSTQAINTPDKLFDSSTKNIGTEIASSYNVPTDSTCKSTSSSDSYNWGTFIGRDIPTHVASSSNIMDKLEELKYNIQKNNIIEDNLSMLLDL